MVRPDKIPSASEVSTTLLSVEAALTGIEASHPVDSRLSDAFRTSALYRIGPDANSPSNAKSELLVARLKGDSLDFAGFAISHVVEGTFRPMGVDKESRAQRRDLNHWSVNDWVGSSNPGWVDLMVRTEEQGLDRSHLLSYLRDWLEIYYQLPARQQMDPTSQPTGVFGKLLSHVVKSDRITARDFPQDELDARVSNFLDLAQFEMAALFMSDTFNLGCMGGKQGRQAARQLSRAYTPTAFSYDLSQKRLMMQEVAVHFGQLKAHVQGADNKEILDIMSNRSLNVTTSLDSVMDFFRTVYRNLGYELPDILRDREQDNETVAVVVTVGNTALNEPGELDFAVADEAEVTVDPALIAEMASRSATLAEGVSAFSSHWSLNNRQHKPYAELARQMGLGFVTDAGRRLSPLPNARDVVDTVVHLYRISQDREGSTAAAERLVRAIERQHELQAANRELRRWGSENSIPYNGANFPLAHDVEGLVRTIRGDWTHIAQAIRRHWPRNQVAGVTESVERLFAAYDQRTAAPIEVERP